MTPEQKTILKKQLTSMAYIAKYAKECSLYYWHLKNVIHEHNVSSYDIDFFQSMLESTLIAEIYKLFSKKDCHSFNKLKNQLKDSYNLKDLSSFLEKKYEDFKNTNILTRFNNDLDLVKVNRSELMEDIKKVRDKQVAHTEEDVIELQNSWGDILICVEHCIEFAIETIKELHQMIFNEAIDFDFESSFYGKTNFELLNTFIEKKENF